MIKITKMSECATIPLDIFVLRMAEESILINDDYNGFMLLDKYLNVLELFPIPDELLFYDLFQNKCGSKIFMYEPSDGYFVFFSLKDKRYMFKNFDFGNITFDKFTYWDDDRLILVTYKGEFYIFFETLGELKKVDFRDIQKHYPLFFMFWLNVKRRGTRFEVNSYKQTLVYHDSITNYLIHHDYKTNKTDFIPGPETKDKYLMYVRVLYTKGIFICVSENHIEIKKDGITKYIYPPNDHIRCFNARYMTDGDSLYLYVLFDYEGDIKALIHRYKIEVA